MAASPVPTLPTQVAPPVLTLSELAATEVAGAEAWAFPVLPADGEDGSLGLGPGAEQAGELLGLDLLGVLEAAKASGRTGEVTSVPVASDRVRVLHLVGVGDETPTDFRRAGAALARATKDTTTVASTVASIAPAGGLEAFVVGAVLASFGFHWRSEGPKEQPVEQIVLAGTSGDRQGELDRAVAVAAAGWRSRQLATVPSNLKNPGWLVEQAEEIATAHGLDVQVWDEDALEKGGFGGILAVGRASATPPRLVQLDYTPDSSLVGRARKVPHVVLVGKGITFDTGGLDIKPAEGMLNMKRDMTGGAVVLATMAALADVGCPVRVTGLVALAENAIGGSSMRPGDVVVHYGGRTSEVNNTDAEGRLVMADAMAYAVDRLQPDVLADVATLTGAMKVALGQGTGGFFANHEGLADTIAEAGRDSGELVWRLPLVEDYEEKLASKIADADNAAGGAGAITAALFLQHFVGGLPWVHLDVASVGDAPADRHEWTAGPTGFGARLLLSWLGSEAPLAGLR